jgi:hypothetical protein
MLPPDQTTLAPNPDHVAWTPTDAAAPAGAPLLLPRGWDAIGLDGRLYAAEAPEGAAGPEGAASSLGPYTEFVRAPGVGVHQLPIPGFEDPLTFPVLSEWERARVAGSLAHRAGRGTETQTDGPQDRLAKCCHGVRRTKAPPKAHRTDRGAWKWTGLVQCGERCCPRCGPRFARATAEKMGALFSSWLHGDDSGLTNPDVWMLSLALPHRALDEVADLVDDLYDLRKLLLASPAWRAFASRWGISSTVTSLDVTFGGDHGAHPHLHIALLASGAWVTGDERRRAARWHARAGLVEPDHDDDRPAYERALRRAHADDARADDPAATWVDAPLSALDRRERTIVLAYVERTSGLFETWAEMVGATLLPERTPFGRNKGKLQRRPVTRAALRLTPGEDAARYFTAWGLESEIGGTAIKSKSHLRLLDAAGAGSLPAALAWRVWREATKGRQWVVGLGDAMKRQGLTDEDVAAWAKARTAERDAERRRLGPVREWVPITVEIAPALWPGALALGLDVVERIASEAADDGRDAQDAVSRACWSALLRAPPSSG